MERLLSYCFGLIIIASLTDIAYSDTKRDALVAIPSVSVPLSEIQAQFHTKDIFQFINSKVRPYYSGNFAKLCDGENVSLNVADLSLSPEAWFRKTDGRYGITLTIEVRAFLNSCLYTGYVKCTSSTRFIGALANDPPPIAICRAEGELDRLLSFGLVLFKAPPLFTRGTPVSLPSCEPTESEYSCIEWVKRHPIGWPRTAVPSGFVADSAMSRSIKMASRVFGYSGTKTSYPQPLDNIVINAHVGERADFTTRELPIEDAIEYALLRPIRDESKFALRVRLEALSDLYDREDQLVSKGLLGQLLPVRIFGRDRLGLFGLVDYSFIVNSIEVLQGVDGMRKFHVLDFHSSFLRVTRVKDDKEIDFFKDVTIRVTLDTLEATQSGDIKFSLRDVDIRLTGVLGFMKFRLRGAALTSLINMVIESIKVGQFESEFRIETPRCIVIEGEHTGEELEACKKAGLLRHVGGIRGVKGVLRQKTLEVVDDQEAFHLEGTMDLEAISVRD